MQTRPLTLITTGSALAASSLAHAHGSGSADSSVYHYLSSPDHVIGFVVLGVVVLATGVFSFCMPYQLFGFSTCAVKADTNPTVDRDKSLVKSEL